MEPIFLSPLFPVDRTLPLLMVLFTESYVSLGRPTMAEEVEYIWKGDIPVPKHLIEYVDEAVMDALPPGTQCHCISPSGVSYWARTAKIDGTDADGNKTAFFLKVSIT
jgi:hypothetical protein